MHTDITYCPMTVHLRICGFDCPGCSVSREERAKRVAKGEHPCDVYCGEDRYEDECGKRTGAYRCPAERDGVI